MKDGRDFLPPLLRSAWDRMDGEVLADFFVSGIGWVEHVSDFYTDDDHTVVTISIAAQFADQFYDYDVPVESIHAIRWRRKEGV